VVSRRAAESSRGALVFPENSAYLFILQRLTSIFRERRLFRNGLCLPLANPHLCVYSGLAACAAGP
jgi:hypothetical protein